MGRKLADTDVIVAAVDETDLGDHGRLRVDTASIGDEVLFVVQDTQSISQEAKADGGYSPVGSSANMATPNVG